MAGKGAPLLPQNMLQPGVSLRQLWAMVWAYRRWIAAATLGSAVLAVAISKLLPKTYEATATVFVDFEVNDPLSGRDFPSQLAASYMATQIDLITSPTTLLPVVDRLELTRSPAYTAGFGGEAGGGLREYAMAQLARKLEVRQAKDSRIIYVEHAANDAQTAARVANTVAQIYIEEQAGRAAQPAREQAERYGAELESLRRKVDEAQAQVTAFRQRSGLIDLDQKADVETQRLMELDRRLGEARSRRLEAQQRASRSSEGDASVLGSGLVQSLKSQLAAKEAELAERSQRLGRRHPDYIALQAEIAIIRERLQREVSVYGSGARAEAASSHQIEAQLQREMEQQREKVLESQRLRDEGARYLRELETVTKVYEKALEGYDQVLIGSRSRYSNARLLSAATPPMRHSRPKTLINLVLGVFAGLGLGLAGSLLYELLNRRVRCRDDVEQDLGLAVLEELGPAPSP